MSPKIEALKHHADPHADTLDLRLIGRATAAVTLADKTDSTPSTTTSSGTSNMSMQRRKVVLPDPDAQ